MKMSEELLPLADHDSWLVDVLRTFVIAGALLLIVVFLRLAWKRWRHPQPGEVFTHPAVYVSYAVLLIDITMRRLQYIDEQRPPDIFLPISLVAIATGLFGVLRRVRFSRANENDHDQQDRAVGQRQRLSDEKHDADDAERRVRPPRSRRWDDPK